LPERVAAETAAFLVLEGKIGFARLAKTRLRGGRHALDELRHGRVVERFVGEDSTLPWTLSAGWHPAFRMMSDASEATAVPRMRSKSATGVSPSSSAENREIFRRRRL
jgi:hypothetical protein